MSGIWAWDRQPSAPARRRTEGTMTERYPKWLKWMAVASAAYGILPMDLIPDLVPILGLMDDAIFLSAVAFMLVAKFLASPRLATEPSSVRRR